MIPKILTFLDLETTGTSVTHDRVIEIGIVRVENFQVKETFESLVDPGIYVPTEIERFTGIRQVDLVRAPNFLSIIEKVEDLLSDSLLVAHNARFDTGFLKNEYERVGKKFKQKSLCSAKLSRLLFPSYKRHNLDSIIERFDLSCKPRHRALPDATVIFSFFETVHKQDSRKLEIAIKNLLKKPTLPQGLSNDQVDKLPSECGVYIFYNKIGTPLYVGKSKDIKSRVLSHFYTSHKSTREFQITQLVHHIETEVKNGELAALLREKELIQKLKPTYNRRLRELKEMVVLIKNINKDGYLTAHMSIRDNLTTVDLQKVVGIYRNIKQAKSALTALSDEYTLCDKLLGLEKSSKACFGLQIEKCKGACIKAEPPLKYNMRFDEAFFKTKIKSWPFEDVVIVKESDIFHVIYKWCYLGQIKNSDGLRSIHFDDLHFDYDIYKIFSNRILTGNARNIQVIKLSYLV